MLCGNKNVRDALSRMTEGKRLAQCLLFYGEKGLGKKTLALWFAQKLLCTDSGSKPCGICKNCRNIAAGVHPDVIWVQHTGKLQGFSAETVRNVCSEAIIAPNSGDKKIYIFSDCDNMDVRSQNILLKVIEEPPAFTHFIFTAGSRQTLLPTVISRLVPFGISQCTEQEASSVLIERGYSPENAAEAVSCFHGNIGMCIAYLEDENLQRLAALTKEAVRCIIDKREYDLMRAFFSAGSDRNSTLSILNMLECVFRDAMALKIDSSLHCTGCDYEGASALSARLSAAKGQHYHKCIRKAYAAISANVNVQLVLTAICAELMGGK